MKRKPAMSLGQGLSLLQWVPEWMRMRNSPREVRLEWSEQMRRFQAQHLQRGRLLPDQRVARVEDLSGTIVRSICQADQTAARMSD